MSNDHEADARDAAPVEPAARPARADGPTHTGSHAADLYAAQAVPQAASPVTHADQGKKVPRGWLIAAVAAGGALLLALAFGGGIATGLGIGTVTRGGLVAEQAPGQGGPGHAGPGGEQRSGPGAGPGRERPGDGDRQDRQGPQSPTETPGPTPTPST